MSISLVRALGADSESRGRKRALVGGATKHRAHRKGRAASRAAGGCLTTEAVRRTLHSLPTDHKLFLPGHIPHRRAVACLDEPDPVNHFLLARYGERAERLAVGLEFIDSEWQDLIVKLVSVALPARLTRVLRKQESALDARVRSRRVRHPTGPARFGVCEGAATYAHE